MEELGPAGEFDFGAADPDPLNVGGDLFNFDGDAATFARGVLATTKVMPMPICIHGDFV